MLVGDEHTLTVQAGCGEGAPGDQSDAGLGLHPTLLDGSDEGRVVPHTVNAGVPRGVERPARSPLPMRPSGGGGARRDLDGGMLDAVAVEDGKVRIGIERLGREDARPLPRTLGEQLHRDDRVESRLPCDGL